MPNSFRDALAGYATTPDSTGTLTPLTNADRKQLKRWADDERAEEIWQTINCAIREHGLTFPDGFIEWWFIQEILGQRKLAESIGRRSRHRDLYRKNAAQLQRTAEILRQKMPDDGPLLIPTNGDELARMLEDAAKQYRDHVAVSWNMPDVVRWNRQSKPSDIFISSLSNILKDLAGRWLDYEVAVLAQIAFDDPDIDNEQVIWIRRGVERSKAKRKAAD